MSVRCCIVGFVALFDKVLYCWLFLLPCLPAASATAVTLVLTVRGGRGA